MHLAGLSHAECPVVVHADENAISSPQPSFVGLVVDSRVASCEPAYFAFQYATLTTLPLLIVYTSQEKAARSPLRSVLDPDLERGLTREEELSVGEVIAGLPRP